MNPGRILTPSNGVQHSHAFTAPMEMEKGAPQLKVETGWREGSDPVRQLKVKVEMIALLLQLFTSIYLH